MHITTEKAVEDTVTITNEAIAEVNTITENAVNEVHTSNENTLAEVNTLVGEVREELQNVPNAENMANLQRQITENKNSISTNNTNIANLTSRVTNIEGVEQTAVNTTYDNSTSGMSATNVQGAIDELKSDISNNIYTKTEVDNKIGGLITSGTTDLTAGTSSLASGVIYAMYE